MNYLYLGIAILFEVVATTALKQTDGFTRLVPSLLAVTGYAFAFYFLSLPMRTLPVGIIYALWSGIGMVFIAGIGWVLFHQSLDLAAIVGIALIISGVVVLNLFSKTLVH
ncbi:MAG: multidrug efflux SMR transporter [Rhizobiaceae bacterium]|jgi:small multidrug resistance pump|nr:multidrug efflux SMR transporter [Rhizobiaceae bacterium]